MPFAHRAISRKELNDMATEGIKFEPPAQSRDEDILYTTLQGQPYEEKAESRIEDLLIQLNESIISGGGGGFTPTTSQLAAMNSGIDSEKVEQITENTNDITSVQAEFDNFAKNQISVVQGAIAAATGKDSTNSNYCRIEEYIKKDSLYGYVPLGIAAYLFCYSRNTDSGFISRVQLKHATQTEDRNVNPTIVNSKCPSGTSYVRISICTDGSTRFSPTDAANAGVVFSELIDISSVAVEEAQYIDIQDITLTADTTFLVKRGSQCNKNMIISLEAMYETEGDGVPTLKATRNSKGYDGVMREYYGSAKFPIGLKGNYIRQQFRVAPFQLSSGNLTVGIEVPEGVTLHVKQLSNEYDNMVVRETCGVHLNAHGYCGGAFPANTLTAFEGAARMGYKYCITIPKVTSDGVYVCLHDDDSIQATARNNDGSQIATEYQNRPVSDFTYQQLLQFDFGISRGLDFAGQRIPLLADFFKICARTGMHPMLSVHPNLSGHWDNIKAMAKKYGVLDKLNIKSDVVSLAYPMAVLGSDIESYTTDQSTATDITSDFETLLTTNNIDRTKVRCIMEFKYSIISDALIEAALTAGFAVGVFNYTSNDVPSIKQLIEKGVTEFADDYIASVGLNW